MTKRKQVAAELLVELNDLCGSGCKVIAPSDVPPVPNGAKRFDDPEGHKDTVYDYGSERWRYRKGKLIAYIVYGDRDSKTGTPRIIGLSGGRY